MVYGSVFPKFLATTYMSRMSIFPSGTPGMIPVMSAFGVWGHEAHGVLCQYWQCLGSLGSNVVLKFKEISSI